MKQKYNLIHLLPSLEAPALSALYLKSFLNATKKYELCLPSSIVDSDAKFCGKCGCVRISNFNTKMWIDEDTADKTGSNQRTLIYLCLNCGRKAKFPLICEPQEDEVNQQENSNNAGFVANWPKSVEKKDVNKVLKKNTAKERAKKRKSSTLSSMLAEKSESQKKKTLSSLNLESFMEHD